MFSRSPAVALAPWSNLQPFASYTLLAPQCANPSRLPCNKPRYAKRKRCCAQRHFATVAGDPHHLHGRAPPWPESLSPCRPPDPYQIFNIRRDEPYSKRQFFELVKIYHPDRNDHTKDESGASCPCGCPRQLMLERYRLIVAANIILSDPHKRDAYDRTGYGWDNVLSTSAKDSPVTWKYTTTHRWRKDGSATYRWPVEQDPMYNATWEDWERWYRWYYGARRSDQRKRGIFASNYAFISGDFLLAALSGVGQAVRLEDTSKTRQQRIDAVSEEVGKELQKARQSSWNHRDQGETKDGRIRRFVQEKEQYEKGEPDGRVLGKHEEALCSSDLIKDDSKPKFWQRPAEPWER